MKNELRSFYVCVIRILEKWNRTEGGNAMKNNRRKFIGAERRYMFGLSVFPKYQAKFMAYIYHISYIIYHIISYHIISMIDIYDIYDIYIS